MHQGFLAADPERISLASAAAINAAQTSPPTTPLSITPTSDDLEDRLSSGWGRAGSVILDVGGCDGESVSRSAPSRLAASLKARLAVRRRPVVKWRPYPRPPAPAPPTMPLPEVLLEEVRAGLPAGAALPPGVFEDECAFMWRTIEDEGTPPHSPLPWETPPEAPPPSPPRPARPPRAPRAAVHLEVPRPRLLIRRPSGSRRGRRPPQRRMRCNTCSLPMLAPRARPRPPTCTLTRTRSCPALTGHDDSRARQARQARQDTLPPYLDPLPLLPLHPTWTRQDTR